LPRKSIKRKNSNGPGVYIAQEKLGVCIEDDYVMADDGAVCRSYRLPKGADEIEHLMRGA